MTITKERDTSLEINIRDDSKIVEIWLTSTEAQNAKLREHLKPLYREYKANQYTVAVFESGGRDVADATSDLICYNRKRIAQLHTKRSMQRSR